MCPPKNLLLYQLFVLLSIMTVIVDPLYFKHAGLEQIMVFMF